VLSVLPVADTAPGYAASVFATLDERSVLDDAIQKLRTHVELQLEKFRLTYPETQLNFRVISHVYVDSAAHCLVALASELAVNLIVIGTHNRKGVERLLLGSVAQATVRDARCPVLVIPAPAEPDAELLLAPPCPECVQARTASGGKEFWCAQHRERHGRRHTYHQTDRSSRDSNFPLVFR